ncbi:hypothetical protein BKA57DRAFT_450584, partial [Linnemannia elongata]
MMRCTMLSLSRSRLALPTSPSSSTTLPPPSTTSTTAGARPTTSWMDLTRLSSPPRQPSRLPTARTSVSSGRNARLLSLEHVQKDVIVDKKVEVDEAKEIIITKETGVVAKPAAPKGTSWFRKIATATGAAVVGAGAVAADAASGAGHAAHGA